MNFSETTALHKLLKMKKKIRDVRGSTGAGKTIGITMWDIDFAQSVKNQIIDVVSESYPHLDQGVMRDFKSIMVDRNYWQDARWNGSNHFYKFESGSEIHFQSFDKLGKAHGPRRDVLHLNEANYLPWNTVDQLITRTRKVVWAEYNPSLEFWMHTEIIGRRDDVESLKLTYRDNEGLTEAEVAEIEAHRNNPRWWRVYGEGELGEAEGRIYTGWRIIPEIPHEARLERYGLDFGYHPDPAALASIYYCDGGYILDENLYARQQDNNALASLLRNLPPALVIADSAEPKSIAEIAAFSVNIIGADKGADSKRYGIKAVQSQKISVTARSVNLIKEYRNYFQKIDKKTNLFIMGETEGDDHLMDALRYGLCSLLPMIARHEYLAAIPSPMGNRKHNPI